LSRRRLLPLLLLAPLLAVQACGDTNSNPADTEATVFAQTAPANREPVKFVFYTHCGVENARIGTHWWHADEPLYGDGGEGTGPPAGWDNPYQEGLLTVESTERAVFTAKGTEVVLVPAATDRPVRVCR